MKKLKTLKQLHENYLVAVVRGKSKDDAIAAVQQMIEGGIHNIEITLHDTSSRRSYSTFK